VHERNHVLDNGLDAAVVWVATIFLFATPPSVFSSKCSLLLCPGRSAQHVGAACYV
jgi:hypothetical protein